MAEKLIMATTASFKQQCPSCEAWVPIRDPNLIGRKIDCPKCKYRFVVEDPGTEAEADDDTETSKPTSKSPGDADRARKATATKAKAGPRRRGEDEEDDEGPAARPKSSGGSTKLILGVGLGFVALAILVVVGLFIFGGDTPPKTTPVASNRSSPPPAQGQLQPAENTEQATAPKPVAPPTSNDALNNLLPPETEGVCNIRLKDLKGTSLGRTIFDTAGAFQVDAVRERLGVQVSDIDQLLQGWNFTQNWSFNVVHSIRPINMQAVQVALRLQPAPDGRIEDQDYFLLEPNPWLDNLGRMTVATFFQVNPLQVPPRAEPLALRLHDDRTLIIASATPMKEFLGVKGRFAAKSKPAVVGTRNSKPEGSEGPGLVTSAGAGGPPSMAVVGSSGGEGRGDGRSEGGTPAAGGAAAGQTSSAYLTVDANLKNMLDYFEIKQPIISIAVQAQPARARLPMLSFDTLNFKVLTSDAEVIGASLILKDSINFTIAADMQSDDAARRRLDALRKKDGFGEKLAAQLGKILSTKVEMTDEPEKGQELPGGGGFTPGGGGFTPGGEGRFGGDRGAPGMEAGGGAAMDAGVPGPRSRPPTQQQEEKDERPRSTIRITLYDRTTVLVAGNLVDKEANSKFMNGAIRQLILQQKGHIDMANGRMRVHELAAAAKAYADKHESQFPRGTADRPTSSTRANRPYAPDQRVSWMAELLPYLGPEQQTLYPQIDRKKSWRDPENLAAASTLVPQFLDPQTPPEKWWGKYPGMKEETAVTHFVGIAGIGLDAAEYSAQDAAVAKKLGAFGYERATSLKDITDGAANTILMAQVAPNFRRPWLAGGGSTVMGVPEKNSVKPFVSTQRDGKRGTMVIMADGSVRFVSETVSDDVFKALCTIKGGESVIVNRDAPLVPAPEVRTEVVAAATPSVPAPSSVPAPVNTWRDFSVSQWGFTILMPGDPTAKEVKTPTPEGQAVMRFWELEKNGANLSVMLLEAPRTIEPGEVERRLNAARNLVQFASKGTVKTEKVVSLDGNPGRAWEVDVPNEGLSRVRAFIVKSRIYFVSAGPIGKVSSEDIDKFLDSFKVSK
jgi:hypothetical protein